MNFVVNRITLNRMNKSLPPISIRWIAVPVLVALALVAAGSVFVAASRSPVPQRVLVVVDATAGRDDALVDRAEAALARAERAGVEGQLRVTRTPTEQLSVTRYFAALGYDRVIAVGLDRSIAVEPVAHRYPELRFSLVDGSRLPAAIARTAR